MVSEAIHNYKHSFRTRDRSFASLQKQAIYVSTSLQIKDESAVFTQFSCANGRKGHEVIPIVSGPGSQRGGQEGATRCAKYAHLLRKDAFAVCAGPGGATFTPDHATGPPNLSGALAPGMGPGGGPFNGGGPPMAGPGPQMGGMGAPSLVPVAAAVPGQPMPKKHFGLEQVISDES